MTQLGLPRPDFLVRGASRCPLESALESAVCPAPVRPGNLIRTPDGKICILDFGLMTDVTPEQSLALVEYIAHLSVQDWNAVTGDLRRLGAPPAPSRSPGRGDGGYFPQRVAGVAASACVRASPRRSNPG